MRQKKCGSNKINVLSFKDQSQPQPRWSAARRRHAVRLAGGRIRGEAIRRKAGALGDIYEAAPYGYVLPKDETEFAEAIVEALKEIEKDGAYKAALRSGASNRALSPTSR